MSDDDAAMLVYQLDSEAKRLERMKYESPESAMKSLLEPSYHIGLLTLHAGKREYHYVPTKPITESQFRSEISFLQGLCEKAASPLREQLADVQNAYGLMPLKKERSGQWVIDLELAEAVYESDTFDDLTKNAMRETISEYQARYDAKSPLSSSSDSDPR